MVKEKNNTYCSICGKGYYLCKSCKSYKLTPWKAHTDTSEHYKIFQILRGVFLNVYTKDEAKDKLQNVDLSDLDTFREDIQNRIKDILNSGNETENIETQEVKDIVTEIPVVKKSRKKKFNQIVETEEINEVE